MTYATRPDIDATYGEHLLHQVANDGAGAVDVGLVERALADATDEVDLSLRGRYQVPLSPVPKIVQRWVIDIALSMMPAEGAAGSDLLTDRAKAARQALKDLRSGATSLDLPVASTAGTSASDDVRFTAPAPTFTDDAMGGF